MNFNLNNEGAAGVAARLELEGNARGVTVGERRQRRQSEGVVLLFFFRKRRCAAGPAILVPPRACGGGPNTDRAIQISVGRINFPGRYRAFGL